MPMMNLDARALLGADELESCLQPGKIGARLEYHCEIGSTNTRAKELAASGAPHGTVVLADKQHGGRGRFGRVFHSPGGCGMYMSAVLRPEIAPERAVLLTCMAAVAVARSIEETAGVQAKIKWVNDVYLGDKKVCGILCEAGLGNSPGKMDYVVMGIGVNVGFMDFPEEIAHIADSVSNVCGREISRSRFTAELLNQLNRLWPGLQDGAFMDEYRARSMVIGREVTVLRGGESYQATAVEIDGEGSLVVRRQDGELETLHSGEISLKLK